MQYLIDGGGDINVANRMGNTPLHVAAQMGDMHAATQLMSAGAQIDAVNKVRALIMCYVISTNRIYVDLSLHQHKVEKEWW